MLTRKRRQPHTQQGLGEQHLQSTVNMGNEQSGLFPLGLYSRGNERKTRDDESLRNNKVPVLCNTANANCRNEWRKRKNESKRPQCLSFTLVQNHNLGWEAARPVSQ